MRECNDAYYDYINGLHPINMTSELLRVNALKNIPTFHSFMPA